MNLYKFYNLNDRYIILYFFELLIGYFVKLYGRIF